MNNAVAVPAGKIVYGVPVEYHEQGAYVERAQAQYITVPAVPSIYATYMQGLPVESAGGFYGDNDFYDVIEILAHDEEDGTEHAVEVTVLPIGSEEGELVSAYPCAAVSEASCCCDVEGTMESDQAYQRELSTSLMELFPSKEDYEKYLAMEGDYIGVAEAVHADHVDYKEEPKSAPGISADELQYPPAQIDDTKPSSESSFLASNSRTYGNSASLLLQKPTQRIEESLEMEEAAYDIDLHHSSYYHADTISYLTQLYNTSEEEQRQLELEAKRRKRQQAIVRWQQKKFKYPRLSSNNLKASGNGGALTGARNRSNSSVSLASSTSHSAKLLTKSVSKLHLKTNDPFKAQSDRSMSQGTFSSPSFDAGHSQKTSGLSQKYAYQQVSSVAQSSTKPQFRWPSYQPQSIFAPMYNPTTLPKQTHSEQPLNTAVPTGSKTSPAQTHKSDSHTTNTITPPYPKSFSTSTFSNASTTKKADSHSTLSTRDDPFDSSSGLKVSTAAAVSSAFDDGSIASSNAGASLNPRQQATARREREKGKFKKATIHWVSVADLFSS